MTNVLVVEDHIDTAFLLTQLIETTIADATIVVAYTSETAIPQIAWADLIISDFNFPTAGFLGLLPSIQAEKKSYILQSAELDCIKMYDTDLQIASIYKGADFNRQIIDILKTIC